LDVQSDERRCSSSLPVVFSSRDRKSGRRSRQQQSTDSAISDNDDILSTSSSTTTSAASSLLRLHATPTAGHVTPVARQRCGMTPSGDDLFPVRMRTMTACPIDDDDDDVGRPTADDTAKRRVEPTNPKPEIRPEEVVSATGRSRRQRGGRADEDSGRSTSDDDYASDYEDRGATTWRWRDDSAAATSPRRPPKSERLGRCVGVQVPRRRPTSTADVAAGFRRRESGQRIRIGSKVRRNR